MSAVPTIRALDHQVREVLTRAQKLLPFASLDDALWLALTMPVTPYGREILKASGLDFEEVARAAGWEPDTSLERFAHPNLLTHGPELPLGLPSAIDPIIGAATQAAVDRSGEPHLFLVDFTTALLQATDGSHVGALFRQHGMSPEKVKKLSHLGLVVQLIPVSLAEETDTALAPGQEPSTVQPIHPESLTPSSHPENGVATGEPKLQLGALIANLSGNADVSVKASGTLLGLTEAARLRVEGAQPAGLTPEEPSGETHLNVVESDDKLEARGVVGSSQPRRRSAALEPKKVIRRKSTSAGRGYGFPQLAIAILDEAVRNFVATGEKFYRGYDLRQRIGLDVRGGEEAFKFLHENYLLLNQGHRMFELTFPGLIASGQAQELQKAAQPLFYALQELAAESPPLLQVSWSDITAIDETFATEWTKDGAERCYFLLGLMKLVTGPRPGPGPWNINLDTFEPVSRMEFGEFLDYLARRARGGGSAPTASATAAPPLVLGPLKSTEVGPAVASPAVVRRSFSDRTVVRADTPAEVDLLARQPYAKFYVDHLNRRWNASKREASEASELGARNHAFVTHLSGEWGSGKSTLFRLIKKELTGKSSGGWRSRFRRVNPFGTREAPPSLPERPHWHVVKFNA